jgi:tetratricopeptide (TPR) repeat protein
LKKILTKTLFVLVILFAAVLVCAQDSGQYMDDAKFILGRDAVAPTKNAAAQEAYVTGTSYMQKNKFNEAESYLLNAIKLDPEYVDAMDHLGIVYRRQGRFKEAQEIYLRSLYINENNPVPWQNLALVYRNLKEFDEAIVCYEKLGLLDPDDPESDYGLGEVERILGNYEKSIQHFNSAIKKYMLTFSEYVYDAYYYQGLNYYDIDDYAKALQYFKLAQEEYSDSADLKRLIKATERLLED